jgi:hypothetical protein
VIARHASVMLAIVAWAATADASDHTTRIPRAIAAELEGCWEMGRQPLHRIVLRRAGRGVRVDHRSDTWMGSRRALRTELHRGNSDGALFFAGFSHNHHAGLLVVRRSGDDLEVSHYYRIGPDRPWRGGQVSRAHRCS